MAESLFVRAGLSDKLAATTAANAHHTAELTALLERFVPGCSTPGTQVDEARLHRLGPLLHMVMASWPKKGSVASRAVIEAMVGDGQLDSLVRVKEALQAAAEESVASVTQELLRTRCGVGVTQGPAEVEATLASLLETHKAMLLEERYMGVNKLRRDVSLALRWADGKQVMTRFEELVLALLGPKESPENQAVYANKKAKDTKAADKKEEVKKLVAADTGSAVLGQLKEGELGLVAGMDRFGAPEDNKQISPRLLEEHLKATGGRVVTRFPPEPNGYLHLGHALSMARVFGYAEAKGGTCILRFDDTNPESEKQEYIDSIKHDVAWMGYKPVCVTYASDHFQRLYDFAEQLIRQGQAYVCHLPMEEMRAQRKTRTDSPYRNRSVEENLRLFRAMRDGCFEEGECTLRVKGNMQSDNPNMRDFVAYRIKYMAHPHAGDSWCIYPSYDYTHAICDSLENITHSICTLEFETRNETYQWLLNALHIYAPPQIEAQRLNMTHIVLSKRKLLILVNQGYVSGWGDPRMPTLMGARRKGYAPRALHDLCLQMGISRSADGMVPIERLEESMRAFYNPRAPRAMALREPVAVVVDNWDGPDITIDVPDFPDDAARGSHPRAWGKHLWMDLRDWRDQDSAKYFGLAPGKRVRFKYAQVVRHVSTDRDADGRITCLHVVYEPNYTEKVKGTLTWLARSDSAPAELRLLKHLFKSPTPGLEMTPEGPKKKDFLLDLHPNSLKPVRGALTEKRVSTAAVGSTFQFERMGYFTKDPDSDSTRTVWNRTVTSKATKEAF